MFKSTMIAGAGGFLGTWRAMSALVMVINTLDNQYFGIPTWHAMSLLSLLFIIKNFH